MKKHIFIVFALFSSSVLLSQPNQSRVITNFDANWKFYLGDAPKALRSNFNDDHWRNLNVPHDWSIELENDKDVPGGGGVGFFPTGIGWYRKTFDVPEYDPEKKYSIEFDGVNLKTKSSVTTILIAGTNGASYTTTRINLTIPIDAW